MSNYATNFRSIGIRLAKVTMDDRQTGRNVEEKFLLEMVGNARNVATQTDLFKGITNYMFITSFIFLKVGIIHSTI